MKVRAQRKFAQKPNTSTSFSSNNYAVAEKRPEPETTQPTQAILKNVQVSATDLLNQVAFQNIHGHLNKATINNVKDVRVVLNRLPAETRRPLNVNVLESQQAADFRVPRIPFSNYGFVRSPPSDVSSLKSIQIMRLRNRNIHRPYRPIRKTEPATLKNRRVSNSSHEDDHPLTYFVASKSESKVIRKRQLHTSTVGQKILPETSPRNMAPKSSAQDIQYNLRPASPSPGTSRSTRSLRRNVVKKSQPSTLQTQMSGTRELTVNVTRDPLINDKTELLTNAIKNNKAIKLGQNSRKKPKKKVSKKKVSKKKVGTKRKKSKRNIKKKKQATSQEIDFNDDDDEPLLLRYRESPELNQATGTQESDCSEEDVDFTKFELEENTSQSLFSASEHPVDEATTRTSPDLPVPEGSGTAANNLAEFIENIFNWNAYAEEGPGQSVIEIRNEDASPETENVQSDTNLHPFLASQKRVEDWLIKAAPGPSTSSPATDGQFKVPTIPPPRISVSLPTSSIVSSRVVHPVSEIEILLRKNCINWEYHKLSNITAEPTLIMGFCLKCTRCTMMFTPAWLQTSSNDTVVTTAKNITAVSEPVADVYDFISESDGNSQNLIRPYNNRIDEYSLRNITLDRIAKDPQHMQLLLKKMTDKGRKVISVAVMMKNVLRNGFALTQKQNMVLAQVMGILIESNRGQALPPVESQNSLGRLDRGTSKKRPLPDPGISRKRTRQSLHAPLLNTQGSITTSLLVNANREDFSMPPPIFAGALKRNNPKLSFCGVKPPSDFLPNCDVNDTSSQFKLRNQYIHRMLRRWGKITKELTVIRSIHDSKIQRSPLFDGLEIDLVKLYHAVQEENGLVAFQNESSKWSSILQKMKLPCNTKSDSKLEKIYLKYLLGYEVMTQAERVAAEEKVQMCWKKREELSLKRAANVMWRQNNILEWRKQLVEEEDEETRPTHLDAVCAEAEECVFPGRSANLNSFKKLAQKVRNVYFGQNSQATLTEIEEQYWIFVMEGNNHVCVYSSSVDAEDNGFPVDLMDPYTPHPWNIKNLSTNSNNLLSQLGPTLGVSSPTIHYGMTFSTSCWHMDPTMVPWIEFLHHGSPKIWYSISADQGEKFRQAVYDICPSVVQNKAVWLPSDIVMVPPSMLQQRGLRVERHVQMAGEYVIVFPNTYYACLDTGFCISEGVYFASSAWIESAINIFSNLRKSFEPSLFSLPKLLIKTVQNTKTSYLVFRRAYDCLYSLLRKELLHRHTIANYGIELLTTQMFLEQRVRATKPARTSKYLRTSRIHPWQLAENTECTYCRCTLDLSRVFGLTEANTSLCLEDAISLFEAIVKEGEKPTTDLYCIILYSNEDLHKILEMLDERTRSCATQDPAKERTAP